MRALRALRALLRRRRHASVTSTIDEIAISSLSLLRGMNQQQLAAVVCTDGPVRVAAGPGTGKTRVLTARIAHLVREVAVSPRRLLAVTFTNKAARELRERVTALIGPGDADAITMGTFHSLCLAMLRSDVERLPEELGYRRGFTVYDEDSSLKLMQKIKSRVEGGKATGAAKQTSEQAAKEEFSAGAVQSIISAAKNDGYDAATFRAQPPRRLAAMPTEQLALVGRVFTEYEATMRAENTVDFDDMLILATTLLRTSERTRLKYSRHWQHICVDEFQDTNGLQYQVVSLLGRDHKNVFVVGDADQAIYGWRGADIRNQARFDSEFVIRPLPQHVPARPLPASAYASVDALKQAISDLPLPRLPRTGGGRRLNLELNYRSRQAILDVAHSLLAPSYAHDPSAQLRLLSATTAARLAAPFVEVEAKPADSPSKRPEPARVPYVLAAQRSFYARKEVRDALSYLRLLRSNDTISLERIINVPPRKIGATTLATLHEAANQRQASLWQALELYALGDPLGAPAGACAAVVEGAAPEAAAAVAPLPKMSKAATEALCRFYELIMRFRALSSAARPDEGSDTGRPTGGVAGELRGGVEGKQCAEAEDDPVNLKLVSTQLRRQFQTVDTAEAIGVLSGYGDTTAGRQPVASVSGGERAADRTRSSMSAESSDGLAEKVSGSEEIGSGSEEIVASPTDLSSLFRLLMVESGYEALAKADTESSRWRNLGELANLARERHVSELDEFLDQIALVSDVDALDAHGTQIVRDRSIVQLSTIHAAKGLEFDAVFLAGVEEGLLPHFYSSNSLDEVEEERRLMYVAMTRAKQHLVVTHAGARGRWGKFNFRKRGGHGRRKIEIEYIDDKIRRHITFSKRKAGISKKAYELSRLTGAQVLLLISSERGQIYSFATPKLQPILVNDGSKTLIEQCLNAPDPMGQPPLPMMPVIDQSQQQHYDPNQLHHYMQTGQALPPGMVMPPVMPQGYAPQPSMQQYASEQQMAAGSLVAMQPDGSMRQAAQQHGYMLGPDGQYVAMVPAQQPGMQQ
ncbi:ATP-dependent DNA helicase [Chrysochromulina tobinii]|uniref:DNA 3'-5' helicase n=1 Tax=Chrysochromulina tobinii TaxID=1460289 RepID=A0A0M0J9F0_9EUKA|nr:ATP-dependent DNA helicase [Chrysochromulina tobinii]|eukprot:KOO22947.1 ATP-dependent DNA helicase [Chrysochromulina sp. CCMP291]